MNRYTKMMMMSRGRDEYKSREEGREHERIDDKFRDRRGREHYDNGRYAPRSEHDGYIESRYDDTSRMHYDNDRYAPMRSEYGQYPSTVPPIYERNDRPLNKIGFAVDGEIHPDYKSDAEYHRMHEMDHMRGGDMTRGTYGGHTMQFNKATAEQWAQSMKNADGTIGAHWNMDQAKQVMAQRGIECDPIEFWIALNAMYSDYMPVAKELGVNTLDFYAKMAKAFIDDEDAYPDKLSRYYQYIVKH